jgi:hypothetical protein
MMYRKYFETRISIRSLLSLSGLGCALFLSACASSSSETRRLTPQDNLRSGGSITAVRPIGLLFASMDTDGRAGLSRAELEAGAEREWAVLNSGAKVSAIDYGNWALSVMGSREVMPNFLSFDSDFNGGLTKKEFKNGLVREFERADKNEDGVVSREESVYLINLPRRGSDQEETQTRDDTSDGVERIPRRPIR